MRARIHSSCFLLSSHLSGHSVKLWISPIQFRLGAVSRHLRFVSLFASMRGLHNLSSVDERPIQRQSLCELAVFAWQAIDYCSTLTSVCSRVCQAHLVTTCKPRGLTFWVCLTSAALATLSTVTEKRSGMRLASPPARSGITALPSFIYASAGMAAWHRSGSHSCHRVILASPHKPNPPVIL